jgi:hypothetical protein
MRKVKGSNMTFSHVLVCKRGLLVIKKNRGFDWMAADTEIFVNLSCVNGYEPFLLLFLVALGLFFD